jgi:hypothetical protein
MPVEDAAQKIIGWLAIAARGLSQESLEFLLALDQEEQANTSLRSLMLEGRAYAVRIDPTIQELDPDNYTIHLWADSRPVQADEAAP